MPFAADWLKPIGFAAVVACHRGAAEAVTLPQPEAAVITIAISASADSTIKLAKFAMGTIEGVVQLPQVRKEGVAVATRYGRSRSGGGRVEIAIIAIIDRQASDTLTAVSFVHLSAWVFETREALLIPQRAGSAAVAAAAQRQTIAMRPNQPRRITANDAADWESLQLVLEEFIRHGARRIP